MTYYKYWVFYLLPKYYEKLGDCLPLYVHDDTYIYAYTDNKDYADQFERCHNMKYFKRKKLNMTTDQVRELTLTERNKYMKLASYATRNEGGVSHVDMIVTMEEFYAVEEIVKTKVMQLSLKSNLVNPDLFSNELRLALNALRYDNFWNYQRGQLSGGVPFDPMTFMVEVDELTIYTKLFGLILVE